MSDSGADAGGQTAGGQAKGGSLSFTEREMQMLGWAMQSLKSGPPEIDYDKLASFAGMTNPRSASNAWAKIRTRLTAATGDGPTPKSTPRKKKAASGDDAGDGAETPTKKTPRKRAAKKPEVDGENPSPKKRGRPAKSAATVDTSDAPDIKNEPNAEDAELNFEDAVADPTLPDDEI